MPYLALRPKAQIPFLQKYAAKVRGMAGLGMGQDCGYDELGDPLPCDTDTSTLDLSNLPVTSPTLGLPTVIPAAPTSGSAPAATSPTGLQTIATVLNDLTAGATNAVKLYNATQTPALIAGTNAIYNPSTGQYYNPTTGQVVSATGASTLGSSLSSLTSSMPNLLLIAGIAFGAFIIISALEKH